MGMVLHIRPAPASQVADLVDDTDQLFDFVTGNESWEADKMWWAVLDLLLGPGGRALLDGEALTDEVVYTPVMRLPNQVLAPLVARLDDIDELVLAERFERHAFGEPLGPEVDDRDRDSLVASALQLRDRLRAGAAAGHDLLFMIA